MSGYSESYLTQLQAMIAKGIEEGQINGERVKFRSLANMLKLERKIKAELGMTEQPARRAHHPVTSTGWR